MIGGRGWLNLAAVGAVLAVPFLLRPRDDLLEGAGVAVVILTPHPEAVRHEFARGFRDYMRTKGQEVRVDWRTPGGTSEIARLLLAEYTASFERYWKARAASPWTASVAAAFANPAIDPDGAGADPRDERLARRTFLASDVGIGVDLLFGGAAFDAASHAAAGRLVDSGFVRSHPEIFHERGVPLTLGGRPLRDRDGRWIGTCLSGFGVCYNRDALHRLGVERAPSGFDELGDPIYFGQISLGDPSKSGSAASAFELLIQKEMHQRAEELAAEGAADIEQRAPREGWGRAMRLIRRIAANARYFTDASTKVPVDVASGDAAAGMCIDYYGRFQSHAAKELGATRLGFAAPRGGTSIEAEPIGLLRGAPHRALAVEFLEFVLSPAGQKLWTFRVGSPGGPERYALRRLPVLPSLYEPIHDAYRSDPDEKPYDEGRRFTYRAAWTGPLYRAIGFVIRLMCVEPHDELAAAYRALIDGGSPPRAAALFDDVTAVDYEAVTGPIRAALASGDPLDEIRLANRLLEAFKQQYRRVIELAREGG